MVQHSGRFVLRVSPELHRRLKDRAGDEGLSLNALCVRLLEAGASREPASRGRAGRDLDPDLVEAIAREWSEDLVGVALFGSAARGNATEASDLDLLVVLDASSRISRSLYDHWNRILRLRRRPGDDRVSPQFVALPRSPEDAGGLWLEVAREGIVLLDATGRLARFLIALRDFIATGAVTRRTAHGHPYWVREGRRQE